MKTETRSSGKARASSSRGLPILPMFNAAFRLHQDPHEWVEHPSALQSIGQGTSEDLRRYVAQCEVEARKARQSGDKDWSAALMEKAKPLKEWLDANCEERSEHVSDFFGECSHKMLMLHWCAVEGDFIARCELEMIIKDCAIRLTHMAKAGSPDAVHLLAELAHSFTKVLNELGRQQPQLVAETAQFLTSWPVLDSPQPMMRGIRPDYQSIRLGAALPVRLERSAKSPVDNPAGRIAWPLLLHVVRVRRLRVALAIKAGEFCDRCERCLELQGNVRGSTVPPVCSGCGFKLLPDEGNSASSGPGRGQCQPCAKTRRLGKPKGAPPFLLSDFIDLPSLIAELRNPTRAISRYLKKRLSPETLHQCDFYLAAKIDLENNDAGNRAGSKFSADDLSGWEYLADRLAAPKSSLDRWLVNQFSKKTKKSLKDYHSAKADRAVLRAELLKDFNRIIGDVSLSDAHCFTGVQLRDATKQLLSQQPEGADRVRLNRLLMEDAYPLAWWSTLTLVSAIAEQFIKIIRTPHFHDADRFRGVPLRSETQSLLARKPQGAALKRLNRMLLEDAYPGHLFRSQTEKVCPLCQLRASDLQQRKETRAGFTVLDRAAYLPELRTDSVGAWWSVAKACLIAGYPHKANRKCLDESSPIFSGIVSATAPSHNKSSGTLRTHILGNLKERFDNFATASPFHKKIAKEKQ